LWKRAGIANGLLHVPGRIGLPGPSAHSLRQQRGESIAAALGDAAPAVLPEAIRLVQLRARVPRYQRDVLVALARQEGTSIDAILQSQLEDLACANAAELSSLSVVRSPLSVKLLNGQRTTRNDPAPRDGLSWPGA
jgi:hypothetical protein